MENPRRILYFKIHSNDIANKSVVFRITETSYHTIHVLKKIEKRFLIKKNNRKYYAG